VHTVRTFDRTLRVHVTFADRVSSFLGGNWQWMWTALLVPAAAYLMRLRRRPATK
jgi:hypothetical protein